MGYRSKSHPILNTPTVAGPNSVEISPPRHHTVANQALVHLHHICLVESLHAILGSREPDHGSEGIWLGMIPSLTLSETDETVIDSGSTEEPLMLNLLVRFTQGIFGNDPKNKLWINHPSNPQQPIQQPYVKRNAPLNGIPPKIWMVMENPPEMDLSGGTPWVSGKLRAGLSMKTMGKSCEINGNYVENVWKLWDITGFMGKL